tara:strand:+ start:3026 stop:3274 length:249 start_codon:yes stop_codon:yes gene_type:complete
MAFTKATLKMVATGGDQQLYIYNSADAISSIIASGYFNTVTDRLKQNDIILVVGATGGTRTMDAIVVASATAAATVTTINGT